VVPPHSIVLRIDGRSSGGEKDAFDAGTLSDRLQEMRVNMMEEDLLRPPTQIYRRVNLCLAFAGYIPEPLPDSGFRVLLQERPPKSYEDICTIPVVNSESS
jgi:hypothetical protein